MDAPTEHRFEAFAFEQNFVLKELARAFPEGKASLREIALDVEGGGWAFLFPFGAVVLCDVDTAGRDEILARLRRAEPRLGAHAVREELVVIEDPEGESGVHDGKLTIDRMTRGRAGTCALTVGQSAAMEYYEGIVDGLQTRTTAIVERLESKGSVTARTRQLHRFIGAAITVRTEVLTVLHLLDKPDATWEDPTMDAIYQELREEFDLVDRYQALESKLRAAQEALELVLGVIRDFRLVVLEAAIVLLIVFEIVLGLVRH